MANGRGEEEGGNRHTGSLLLWLVIIIYCQMGQVNARNLELNIQYRQVCEFYWHNRVLQIQSKPY